MIPPHSIIFGLYNLRKYHTFHHLHMIGLVVYFFIIQAAISSARPEGEAAAAATYVETPTDAATINLGM